MPLTSDLVTPSIWMRRAQIWRRSTMEVTMNSGRMKLPSVSKGKRT